MTHKFVIGCDPGGDGAVAIIDLHGHCKAWRFKDDHDALIRELPLHLTQHPFIVFEDVHAIFKAMAKVTFSFGQNTGRMLGIFEAHGQYPDAYVKPVDWQRAVTVQQIKPFVRGLSAAAARKIKDQHRKALKAESIRAAHDACPKANPHNHDGVADAINIARYGLILLKAK